MKKSSHDFDDDFEDDTPKKRSQPPKLPPSKKNDDVETEGFDVDEDDEPKVKKKRQPIERIKNKRLSDSERNRRERRKNLYVLLFVLLVPVGICGFAFVSHKSEKAPLRVALEQFGPNMQEYCKPPAELFPEKERPPAKPKFLPVNVKEKTTDQFYENIDKDLRANNPNEVGTIVHITWEHRIVGRYDKGGDAKQYFCTVQLIDFATKKAYPLKEIIGPPPPEETKKRFGDSGEMPNAQINAYLRAMLKDGNMR